MKRKKSIIITIAVLFHLSIIVIAAFNVTRAYVEDLPELKTGDIVFQTTNTSQKSAIMLASKSMYTHVGIVKVKDNGEASVIEAVGPVREIPLADWIDKGIGDRITVKRHKELTPAQAEAVFKKAKSYSGKPYDIYFTFDKDKIYCSELVYYAFKEGVGIDVGKIEKVGDLSLASIATKNLIKKRWQSYPPCKAKGANSYEKCLGILNKQTLITPASMADDARLDTIYSNFY